MRLQSVVRSVDSCVPNVIVWQEAVRLTSKRTLDTGRCSDRVGTVEVATESQPRFVQFTVGAKDAEYVFPRGQNGGWRGVLFPT